MGDQDYDRHDCPYCGVIQDPLPKAKRRCPACGQSVYVRSGPDGRRYLLRESDLEAHQAMWDAYNDQQAAQEAAELNRQAATMSGASLQSYFEAGLTHVQVFGGDDDTCPACKAVAGRVFPIQQVPPIPVPGCSNDICRCDYLPVVEW